MHVNLFNFHSSILIYSRVSELLPCLKFDVYFMMKSIFFNGSIILLLNIEITKFKNWYVDNRLNFFLISEFCVDVLQNL